MRKLGSVILPKSGIYWNRSPIAQVIIRRYMALHGFITVEMQALNRQNQRKFACYVTFKHEFKNVATRLPQSIHHRGRLVMTTEGAYG